MEYKSLNLDERRLIEKMNARGISAYEIADIIGRHQATIYRELKRGSGSGKYIVGYSGRKNIYQMRSVIRKAGVYNGCYISNADWHIPDDINR